MVQNIDRTNTTDYAPLEPLQRLRSYSRRKDDGTRETWDETCDRVLYSPHLGLQVLGKFTDEEMELLDRELRGRRGFGSFRFLWVGGTKWITKPEQFPGGFNCSSFKVTDWATFGMLMELAMMGCGTGALVEPKFINQIPLIRNKLNVSVVGEIGETPAYARREDTEINSDGDLVEIIIGDSRKGWVDAYQGLLELSTDDRFNSDLNVIVDVSNVRPKGSPLKQFGGVANPVKLPDLFPRIASILNGAIGRNLNSLEVCLIINEAASVVVAGSIRRSANIQLGNSDDGLFANAKDNLWQQDDDGNWRVDPDRDAMRMANLTRVFHKKPTLHECVEAVRKQFYSGEGAIMWAGEAIARCNADLLNTPQRKKTFLFNYSNDAAAGKAVLAAYYAEDCGREISKEELNHRIARYSANPCVEALGIDFFCTLGSVHLNMIDPLDIEGQKDSFKASALHTVAMLQRGFVNPRQQKSREYDPQTLVSFTGAFTFFVKLFGVEWLKWWEQGRPDTIQGLRFKDTEREYFQLWRLTVEQTIWEYCDRHGLKRPNRCTGLKPEGSGSLLTGVGCNGFHPPKDWYYIRRITFPKDDPIALAAIDFGYTVVPSQSDKDESGKLLDDPFDPRCTEWLVEVPVAEEIVQRFPDAASINPSSFSAIAQFDWYMQVQKHYTTFNTSATLEFREHEIEPLATRIYEAIQNDEGYISSALLARFDDIQSFPRLPFEPITKEQYDRLHSEVLARRKSDDFMELLAKHDDVDLNLEPQDSACSDGYCAIKTDGVKVTPNDRKTLSEELEPIFQEIAVITGEDF